MPQPPRRGWWPDLSAFYDKRVTARKIPREGSVELGASPKVRLKISYEKTITLESSRLLVKVRPKDTLSNDNDGITWQYHPGLETSSQGIQLSRDDPPVHGARYALYANDLPESVVVKVKVTFIRESRMGLRRLGLSKQPLKHIVTCLEVKRVNEGMEWFRFPTENKEGTESKIEATLLGATIREDSKTSGPMSDWKLSWEA